MIVEGEGAVWGVNLRRPIVTGTLLRRCVELRRAIKLSCGVVSGVGPGIHVLDGSPRPSRGRGCFWHGFRLVSNFRVYGIQWTNGILITVMIDDQLMCEKLTIFPYAKYTVEFCVKFPFL